MRGLGPKHHRRFLLGQITTLGLVRTSMDYSLEAQVGSAVSHGNWNQNSKSPYEHS